MSDRVDRGDSRVTITGEEVSLPPATAQALALVVHELATNAAKHGALSVPTGRVDLAWGPGDAPDGNGLGLVWSETGGPETAPPTRRGFGRRPIERGVGYSLSGQTRFEFRPEGLRCEITIPLDRAAARA